MNDSGNEDNSKDEAVGKNKKVDPHRALNIDLDAKPIPKPPTPPVQVQQQQPIEKVPLTTEKPKKTKKKKTTEKEGKSKPKLVRERSDYKELLSPADEEEKRVVPPPPPLAPPAATTTEEKPKKKKTKEKKSTTTENKSSTAPLLFDIMSDDINPTNSSNQQYNEQNVYKLAAQSDYLTIVSTSLRQIQMISFTSRNLPSFQAPRLLN